MPQSNWSVIARREPVIGQTRKGKPLLRLETDTGKELYLMGTHEQLNKLSPGVKIQHSEPGEPLNGRYYATLEFIEAPAPQQTTPPAAKDSYQREKELHEETAGNSNGHSVLTFTEYMSLVEKIHTVVSKLEPDSVGQTDKDMPPVYLDRSSARHAMLATILISYGNGNFDYPEIPF